MRNPSEDLCKAQLKHIETLYVIINRIYSIDGSLGNDKDLGYNNNTNKANPRPKQIKFKEA